MPEVAKASLGLGSKEQAKIAMLAIADQVSQLIPQITGVLELNQPQIPQGDFEDAMRATAELSDYLNRVKEAADTGNFQVRKELKDKSALVLPKKKQAANSPPEHT